MLLAKRLWEEQKFASRRWPETNSRWGAALLRGGSGGVCLSLSLPSSLTTIATAVHRASAPSTGAGEVQLPRSGRRCGCGQTPALPPALQSPTAHSVTPPPSSISSTFQGGGEGQVSLAAVNWPCRAERSVENGGGGGGGAVGAGQRGAVECAAGGEGGPGGEGG